MAYTKAQREAFRKAFDSRKKALTHSEARKLKPGRILEVAYPDAANRRCFIYKNEVRYDGAISVLSQDWPGHHYIQYDQVVKVFDVNVFDLINATFVGA